MVFTGKVWHGWQIVLAEKTFVCNIADLVNSIISALLDKVTHPRKFKEIG